MNRNALQSGTRVRDAVVTRVYGRNVYGTVQRYESAGICHLRGCQHKNDEAYVWVAWDNDTTGNAEICRASDVTPLSAIDATDHMGYRSFVDSVRVDTGITLSVVNTGGGCMALHGRFDTPSGTMFLSITQSDDFIVSMHERRERENAGDPAGWLVGVYPHDSVDADCMADDWIAAVFSATTTLDDLPRLVRLACDINAGEFLTIGPISDAHKIMQSLGGGL